MTAGPLMDAPSITTTRPASSVRWDAGRCLLRLVFGGLIAGHGAQKLLGWFGGSGYDSTKQMLGRMGMQPVEAWTPLVVASELGGGVLTAAGLGGPLGPLMTVGSMTTAALTAHRGKPIWATEGGAELPVTNLAIAGALIIAGPGRWSLDALLGVRVPRWLSFAAGAGVLGGALVSRRLHIAHLTRRADAARSSETGPETEPGR